jgi:hypothetical protein
MGQHSFGFGNNTAMLIMKKKLFLLFFLAVGASALAGQFAMRVYHGTTIKVYHDLCGDTNAVLHGEFTFTTNNASEEVLSRAAAEVGVTNVTVAQISEHWNTVSINYTQK